MEDLFKFTVAIICLITEIILVSIVLFDLFLGHRVKLMRAAKYDWRIASRLCRHPESVSSFTQSPLYLDNIRDHDLEMRASLTYRFLWKIMKTRL